MGNEEPKNIKDNNESNNDTHIGSESIKLEDEEEEEDNNNEELTIKKTEFNSNRKLGEKEILYYENGNKKFEGFFKNDNAEGKGTISKMVFQKEKVYYILKMEKKNMKEII